MPILFWLREPISDSSHLLEGLEHLACKGFEWQCRAPQQERRPDGVLARSYMPTLKRKAVEGAPDRVSGLENQNHKQGLNIGYSLKI